MIRPSRRGGFTLAETMIAMVGSMLVLGALLVSSSQLQRALCASEQYSAQQTDQRRLIDYLGRDLRRAVGVSVSTSVNGSGATRLAGASAFIGNGTALVVTLPGFYQTQSRADLLYDESLPVVSTNNYVDYGTEAGHASGVPVMFRKEYVDSERCVCVVRWEAEESTVIVRHADFLTIEVAISSDGRQGTIHVVYDPGSGSIRSARVATHEHLLMRNIRAD